MDRLPDTQIVKEFRAREDDNVANDIQTFINNFCGTNLITVQSIWPFEKTMIDGNLSHVMVIFNVYY